MKQSLLSFLMALEPAQPLNDSPQAMAASMTEFYTLQEKVCSLIAPIALRDWPQQWPELMPTLVGDVASRGVAQQQGVLAVWRMIADEMTVRVYFFPIQMAIINRLIY
jgi:hypothetical protein